MKYQEYLKKIMQQLTEYKAVVDNLATSYLAETKEHERQLESMKGKYTPEFISEERRNWQPHKKDYQAEIRAARGKNQAIATAYLDRLKKELDSYFQVPVNPSFASTVTAIKSLGLTLNNREFDLLAETAGGYWGRRMLGELAESRTKQGQGVELENGQPKRVEAVIKTPYFGVDVPGIEDAYQSYQNVKNAVDVAFTSYCGADCELKNVVFPLNKEREQTNAKIAAEYGIEPPKQTLDNMTIPKMASAKNFFSEDAASYVAFSEMMDKLKATMPKPERKTVLTDSDKQLIDTLISPNYPTLAKSEAVKLAKLNEHLAEILSLDTRYGEEVKKALGEDSGNE